MEQRTRPRPSDNQCREQVLRADGRAIQRWLKAVGALQRHRGCRPTRLGAALAAALQANGTSEALQNNETPVMAAVQRDVGVANTSE